MGDEMGDTEEWNVDEQLRWYLLDCEANKALGIFVKQLNDLYMSCPPMWELDDSYRGFEWILPADKDKGVMAFKRISSDGQASIALLNFASNVYASYEREDFAFDGFEIALDSDSRDFGGKGRLITEKTKDSVKILEIPPFSAVILVPSVNNK